VSLRQTYDEQVIGPGKFEGEPPWVPYFYESWNEGHVVGAFGDSDFGLYAAFYVDHDDMILFPELATRFGTRAVYLAESSDGFVSEISSDQYRAQRKTWHETAEGYP
jgi:hypothetical protein